MIAEAALVDRSGGSVDLGVPFFPLVDIDFPTYAEDEVPEELAAIAGRQSRAAGHDSAPRIGCSRAACIAVGGLRRAARR